MPSNLTVCRLAGALLAVALVGSGPTLGAAGHACAAPCVSMVGESGNAPTHHGCGGAVIRGCGCGAHHDGAGQQPVSRYRVDAGASGFTSAAPQAADVPAALAAAWIVRAAPRHGYHSSDLHTFLSVFLI
jgi:hypothetical protein